MDEDDSTPNPEADSADQRRLRELGRRIVKLMNEAGVAGVVIQATAESASWTFALPADVEHDGAGGGFHMDFDVGTPEGVAAAAALVGTLANVRDISAQCAEVFGMMHDSCVSDLLEAGHSFKRAPIGSPGRVGPNGRRS